MTDDINRMAKFCCTEHYPCLTNEDYMDNIRKFNDRLELVTLLTLQFFLFTCFSHLFEGQMQTPIYTTPMSMMGLEPANQYTFSHVSHILKLFHVKISVTVLYLSTRKLCSYSCSSIICKPTNGFLEARCSTIHRSYRIYHILLDNECYLFLMFLSILKSELQSNQ